MNGQVLLVVLIAVVGVVIVAALGVLLGRVLYVRQVQRSLLRFIGVREAMRAAARGLETVLQRLVAAEDEALEVFAADPASEDRRALDELASRMRITADELKVVALPKRLWPLAEEMESAARSIAEQAGGVGEARTPDDVLDRLAAIRIQDINATIREADEHLQVHVEAFKVDDPAVYGGGLYI